MRHALVGNRHGLRRLIDIRIELTNQFTDLFVFECEGCIEKDNGSGPQRDVLHPHRKLFVQFGEFRSKKMAADKMIVVKLVGRTHSGGNSLCFLHGLLVIALHHGE